MKKTDAAGPAKTRIGSQQPAGRRRPTPTRVLSSDDLAAVAGGGKSSSASGPIRW